VQLQAAIVASMADAKQHVFALCVTMLIVAQQLGQRASGSRVKQLLHSLTVLALDTAMLDEAYARFLSWLL
jgi:hypothetical protein